MVARAAKAGYATAMSDAFEVTSDGYVALNPIVLVPGATPELAFDAVGGELPFAYLNIQSVEGSPPLIKDMFTGSDSSGIVVRGLPRTKIRILFDPPFIDRNEPEVLEASESHSTPPKKSRCASGKPNPC